MSAFNDYIVFIDESGDHGLISIDPSYPIFVLAFCIFEKIEYAERVVPAVVKLKFIHFGHDQVILHEHDIRKAKGSFHFLHEEARRETFYNDLNTLMQMSPFTLIASAIRKDLHQHQYSAPANPYHIAMGFGLERLYMHLNGLGCRAGKTYLVFECRGRKEDAELELEFRRICNNNATGNTLPFEIIMVDKRSNSSGLQLADLVARPIGRHLLNPQQTNRAYEIIETKFRKNNRGRIEGWGLKVFP